MAASSTALSSISPATSSASLMIPSMAGHCVPLASLPRFLKPLDLLVGFFEMGFQAGDEVTVGRLVDHLGQRFDDLLFGIVDVLQTMDQQVFHRFNVLCEDSHSISPFV